VGKKERKQLRWQKGNREGGGRGIKRDKWKGEKRFGERMKKIFKIRDDAYFS
jgi:hypothetical protein